MAISNDIMAGISYSKRRVNVLYLFKFLFTCQQSRRKCIFNLISFLLVSAQGVSPAFILCFVYTSVPDSIHHIKRRKRGIHCRDFLAIGMR
jgi:hypothetical protein